MLRPEANPIHKSKLFSEQRRACEALRLLLRRANPTMGAPKERTGEPQKNLEISDKDFRTNRIIFIDGVAGVGKTTVYLTFRHYDEKEEWEETWEEETDKGKEKKNEKKDEKDRHVWLEPLELAILDSPSNALAELLTHIERKCSKANGESQRSNDKQEKALRDLKNLQSKIALLWDGNPRERAARVSPQGFAAEVVAASEGRAELRIKLNELIDEIAKLFFGGRLLILPIDDLHENPSVALGLLRLMRLIHSPHLVILALGNLHSLTTIERLRARHQLTSFLHETDAHDKDMVEEVKSRAETLGAFSMSKLFCPSQTIKVYPPDTDDSKDWERIQGFVPDGAEKKEGLVKLFLDRLSVSLDGIKSNKPIPKKVLDFTDPDKADDHEQRRRRVFKMPVRYLVNMHRMLERGVKYPIEFCWEMLEQSRLVEYRSGLPDDVFKFDDESIDLIEVSDGYYHSASENEGQKGTFLLEYRESKEQNGKEQNGKAQNGKKRDDNEPYATTRKSVHPTVAAWAHLLLCLHDGEVLGGQVITKGSKKKVSKKKVSKKKASKKKASKKGFTKND